MKVTCSPCGRASATIREHAISTGRRSKSSPPAHDPAASPPRKMPCRKIALLFEHCGWIVRRGRILLEHQTGPRWRGLWKLPALAAAPDAAPVFTHDYPFTHHRITLNVFKQ